MDKSGVESRNSQRALNYALGVAGPYVLLVKEG